MPEQCAILSPLSPPVFCRLFANPIQPEPLLEMLNAVLGLELRYLQFLPSYHEGTLYLRAWDQTEQRHHLKIEPGLTRGDQRRALERLVQFYLRRFQASQPESEPCQGLHLRTWSKSPDRAKYRHTFRWREEHSQTAIKPNLVVHVIDLPAFSNHCAEPHSPEEYWLSFLYQGASWKEPPVNAPELVQQTWWRLQEISQEEGLRHRVIAHSRNAKHENKVCGDALEEARGDALRQQGQRQMLAGVVAYKLDRTLEEAERETLHQYFTDTDLNGLRAYILETSREDLESWLLQLQEP